MLKLLESNQYITFHVDSIESDPIEIQHYRIGEAINLHSMQSKYPDTSQPQPAYVIRRLTIIIVNKRPHQLRR